LNRIENHHFSDSFIVDTILLSLHNSHNWYHHPVWCPGTPKISAKGKSNPGKNPQFVVRDDTGAAIIILGRAPIEINPTVAIQRCATLVSIQSGAFLSEQASSLPISECSLVRFWCGAFHSKQASSLAARYQPFRMFVGAALSILKEASSLFAPCILFLTISQCS